MGLSLLGQAIKPLNPVEVTAQLGYDTFFGFSPGLSLRKSLDSLTDVGVYGTFYPSPAFFGLETAVTLSRSSRRKTWTLMPGLGIMSGSFLVEGRSFLISEGFVGNLTLQYEQAGWYGLGYGAYYGGLQRLTPDAYDFGFYLVQAGRVLRGRTRLGLVYEWLGLGRLPRNRGDTTSLAVSRLGLACGLNLSAQLTLQLAVGLTKGSDQRGFVQVSINRTFGLWRSEK
jgi:hypothetical protein